jgi:hypothetical protein
MAPLNASVCMYCCDSAVLNRQSERQACRLLVTQQIPKAVYRYCLGNSLLGASSVGLLEPRVFSLRHVCQAYRCVFSGAGPASATSVTRQGGMLVAGGCGSIFSVWLNMGTFRGHSMHTTSCMYLWLACFGTRRHGDRSVALPRGLAQRTRCVGLTEF